LQHKRGKAVEQDPQRRSSNFAGDDFLAKEKQGHRASHLGRLYYERRKGRKTRRRKSGGNKVSR